jgi:hypothetical protein
MTLTDLLAMRHVVPLHHVGDTAVLWQWKRMMEMTRPEAFCYCGYWHHKIMRFSRHKELNSQKWRLN